jgi:hypothetical protein
MRSTGEFVILLAVELPEGGTMSVLDCLVIRNRLKIDGNTETEEMSFGE